MSEFVVRGVEVVSVHPNEARGKALETVDFVPARFHPKYVAVPESVVHVDDHALRTKEENKVVFAWTENTLQRMDRLGIMFPISVSLYGPILFPSVEDVSEFVPVWYSTTFDQQREFDIIVVAVIRVVDELMDGTLAGEALSHEDRRFLAIHYPAWRDASAEYRDAVQARLREGVPESELVKWYV